MSIFEVRPPLVRYKGRRLTKILDCCRQLVGFFQLLKPWFLYLRLVLTALAERPREKDRSTVYRGVNHGLGALYPTGATVTWWVISYRTMTIDVLTPEKCLGQHGTRTLFVIDCFSGKSIVITV